MLLVELARCSEAVSEVRGRKRKIAILADTLARLAPEEIDPAVSWLTGRLLQGRIGVGPAALRQAWPSRPAGEATLGVRQVDRELDAIAGVSGAGSKGERVRRLAAMLALGTDAEQRFLGGLLMGGLRQGALEGILVQAVARAAQLTEAGVRRAVMLAGALPEVARAALIEGAPGLSRYRLELFRPVQPMLAQTTDDLEDGLARIERAAIEHKLDGARIQVHKREGEVRIFTRHLKEVTASLPEVAELAASLPARQAILDGEVLALRGDGRPLPFQVTMRRFGRRLDVAAMRKQLPLTPVFFDCLMRDDEPLLDAPGATRWASLEALVPSPHRIPRLASGDLSAARVFVDDALARGHEGVMLKSAAAPYAAGSRGAEWLKLKPTHTLDLVVLAAEWGSGRRKGWLSNLHLGARDDVRGGFVMLGKTFKGLTDETLRWQTEALLARETGRDGHVVHVAPELVVEIAFNELQESPRYPGGLALRFARVRGYRPHKSAAQADTFATVQAIHAARR